MMNTRTTERRDGRSARGKFGLRPRFCAWGLASILLGAAFLSTGVGCTRQKYRTDADSDVYELLNTVNDNNDDQRYWELDGFTLQESGCSR